MKLKSSDITIHGHQYTPKEIAVKLGKRIKDISHRFLKECDAIELKPSSIVVGAPVRFDTATRGTTREIWSEVLNIEPNKIHIVSEPILAAIANNHVNQKGPSGNLLVYDMGHGTFDVVLLKPNLNPTPLTPEPYIAENPDGLEIAGGLLDEYMEELIMDKLRQNPGLIKLSVLENKNHADRRRLRITAREIKEKLSKTESATAIVAGAECGYQSVTITRTEYEAKITPLIQKTVDLSAEVLKKCNLGDRPDIEILLIGGSTHIPLIEKMLKEKFHWLSDSNFSTKLRERAVALGAAIYAESLANSDVAVVAPKVSFGYAVETYSPQQGKTVLDVQIPSNSTLPKSIQGIYRTRFDNQDHVTFNIYEVMSGSANELLPIDKGTQTQHFITHSFGKPVPEDTNVELTTTLSRDGILTMKVDDFGIAPKPTEKTFTLANTVPEEN